MIKCIEMAFDWECEYQLAVCWKHQFSPTFVTLLTEWNGICWTFITYMKKNRLLWLWSYHKSENGLFQFALAILSRTRVRLLTAKGYWVHVFDIKSKGWQITCYVSVLDFFFLILFMFEINSILWALQTKWNHVSNVDNKNIALVQWAHVDCSCLRLNLCSWSYTWKRKKSRSPVFKLSDQCSELPAASKHLHKYWQCKCQCLTKLFYKGINSNTVTNFTVQYLKSLSWHCADKKCSTKDS